MRGVEAFSDYFESNKEQQQCIAERLFITFMEVLSSFRIQCICESAVAFPKRIQQHKQGV